MSTYNRFMKDAARERDGIWVDYGDAGRFLIARAGGANEAFSRAIERLTKDHRKAIDLGLLDSETREKIARQAYAETVLRGWEGVTGEDDQPLVFSVPAAIKLFTDLPDLFSAVIDDSKNQELFRTALREEAAKNS